MDVANYRDAQAVKFRGPCLYLNGFIADNKPVRLHQKNPRGASEARGDGAQRWYPPLICPPPVQSASTSTKENPSSSALRLHHHAAQSAAIRQTLDRSLSGLLVPCLRGTACLARPNSRHRKLPPQ